MSYLNGSHIGVLRRVLVLVQAILCELALAEIDTEFDEEDHDRLEGGNGAVAGALRGDMFVEELEGSLLLLDSDEFLGAFTFGCQSMAMRAVSIEGHTACSPAWSAVAAPCWAVADAGSDLLGSLGAWGASGRRSVGRDCAGRQVFHGDDVTVQKDIWIVG
jgi:hypothetical protein